MSPPQELKTEHTLTVVASKVDPATARLVEYLAAFEVPLNVMFFRYFVDDGRKYLARTWLVDDAKTSTENSRKTAGRKEPWNGQDWYVSFGEDSGSRSWDDARKYGFVSAGGGVRYSRTLRSLPIGARGVRLHSWRRTRLRRRWHGRWGGKSVTGHHSQRRWRRPEMADLPLVGSYGHANDAEDNDEYVVPVDWIAAVDRTEAIWEKGFFANQNSACKLRNRFTLDGLTRRFELAD